MTNRNKPQLHCQRGDRIFPRCGFGECASLADVDFGYPDERSRSTRWVSLCWHHARDVDRGSQVTRREIRFTPGRPTPKGSYLR